MSETYPHLPEQYQFETKLYAQGKAITDDFLNKAEWIGDGLSLNEFDRPLEQLWAATGNLSRYMVYPRENINEVHAAIYRGVSFGYDITEAAKEGTLPMRISLTEYPLEYMNDILKLSQPKERLLQDTADFLDTHPYADDIIDTCMPQLDETARYSHHAKRAAAMVIMACENGYTRLHAEFSDRHRA